MRRMNEIQDKDGYAISYAKAAIRLKITENTLRVRLSHYRKLHPEYVIPLEALRLDHPARIPLVDQFGGRVSYKKVAEFYEIPPTELYRLVRLLQARKIIDIGDRVRVTSLARYIMEDGSIVINGEYE